MRSSILTYKEDKKKNTSCDFVNQSAKYYNSTGWHILRNYHIKQHPLCEECLKLGITRQAEEVHHITPFLLGITDADRWHLLLDGENLMSLCKEHHDAKHRNKNRKWGHGEMFSDLTHNTARI